MERRWVRKRSRWAPSPIEMNRLLQQENLSVKHFDKVLERQSLADRYTGLPLYETFRDSPFAEAKDFIWYVNQYHPFKLLPNVPGPNPETKKCSKAALVEPCPVSSNFVLLI